MVSTHLKHISQIGSFPQGSVKIKNVWNHHLVKYWIRTSTGLWVLNPDLVKNSRLHCNTNTTECCKNGPLRLLYKWSQTNYKWHEKSIGKDYKWYICGIFLPIIGWWNISPTYHLFLGNNRNNHWILEASCTQRHQRSTPDFVDDKGPIEPEMPRLKMEPPFRDISKAETNDLSNGKKGPLVVYGICQQWNRTQFCGDYNKQQASWKVRGSFSWLTSLRKL